uniref:Transmembrane protein n=1 Tax=Macrostomum lignano TaxID=282301 RepID=A0A1I8FJ66_9PLAT
ISENRRSEDSIFPGVIDGQRRGRGSAGCASFCAHSISPASTRTTKFGSAEQTERQLRKALFKRLQGRGADWLHAAESAGGAPAETRGGQAFHWVERPTSLGLSTTLQQQRHLQKQHHHSSTASLESTASLGTSTTGSLEPPKSREKSGPADPVWQPAAHGRHLSRSAGRRQGERKSGVESAGKIFVQNESDQHHQTLMRLLALCCLWSRFYLPATRVENNDGDDDERLCGEQPTLRGLILLTSIFLLSLGGIIVVFASAGLLNFMTLELQQFASLLKVPTELLDSNLNWVYKVLGATGYATANIGALAVLRALRAAAGALDDWRLPIIVQTEALLPPPTQSQVTSGNISQIHLKECWLWTAERLPRISLNGARLLCRAGCLRQMSGKLHCGARRKLTCSQGRQGLSGSDGLMGLRLLLLGHHRAAAVLPVSARRTNGAARRQRESPEQRPLGLISHFVRRLFDTKKQKNRGTGSCTGCLTKAAVDRKRGGCRWLEADAPGAEAPSEAGTVAAVAADAAGSQGPTRGTQADKLRALETAGDSGGESGPRPGRQRRWLRAAQLGRTFGRKDETRKRRSKLKG